MIQMKENKGNMQQKIRSSYYKNLKQFNLNGCPDVWAELFSHKQKGQIIASQKDDSSLILMNIQGYSSQLQKLFFDECKITDSNIAKITSLDWPNLKMLTLKKNPLTDPFANCLNEQNFPNLHLLDLSNTRLSCRGLINLLKLNLPNLRLLLLQQCKMTDQCVTTLSNKCLFPNLQSIMMKNNLLTYDGFQELRHIRNNKMRLFIDIGQFCVIVHKKYIGMMGLVAIQPSTTMHYDKNSSLEDLSGNNNKILRELIQSVFTSRFLLR